MPGRTARGSSLSARGGRSIAPRLALHSARATTALAILGFVPRLAEQFETPKAALVQVIGLGWLAFFLAAGAASIHWTPLDLAVIAWLPVEVLATLLSQSPMLSLLGDVQQHEGLLTTFGLAGIYFAFRIGTRGVDDGSPSRAAALARQSFDSLLQATAVACVYALLQAAGSDPIHWLRTAGYGALTRPFGTMGHPNLLGVMSSACTAICLAATMQQGRRRWLHALAAALFATTTMLTLSRGAWLGLGAGVTAAAAGVWYERRSARVQQGSAPPNRHVLLAAAGALALAVLVILGSGRGELLRSRFGELLRPREGSAASRVEIWRASVAAWRARPWFGHGPDTFELVFPRYQTPHYWRYEWTGLPFHAHSLYLHTLATRGAVGVGLGVVWLAAFAWTVRRVWQRGGAARALVPGVLGGSCAVAVAGAFGAIGVAGGLFLVTASAALAGAAVSGSGSAWAGAGRWLETKRTRWDVDKARVRPSFERRGSIAGGVVAGAACLWCWTDLSASHAAASARVALPSDAPRADSFAARAVRLRPSADWAHRLRAETLAARATAADTSDMLLHQAVEAAQRAVEIEPGRNLNHYRLAKVALALAAPGDVEASRLAAASLRRCIEISPVDAVSMLELARLELQSGNPAAALELASRAAALYPNDGPSQSLLAVALLRDGRSDEARRALERAVAGEWHGNDLGLQTARDLLQQLP